jgi:hypothetical protein
LDGQIIPQGILTIVENLVFEIHVICFNLFLNCVQFPFLLYLLVILLNIDNSGDEETAHANYKV